MLPTIFTKNSVLDVFQGSEYASAYTVSQASRNGFRKPEFWQKKEKSYTVKRNEGA